MSFVIYNTEGNRREDNMESRGRGGGSVGEGGWGRLHKQVALLLQVRCAESSSEGFLTVPEEPESTSFPLPRSFKPESGICAHRDGKKRQNVQQQAMSSCPIKS